MASSRGGSRITAFLFCVSYLVSGQIHYTIPEELEYGAFVGNIVSDLMLNIWELSTRNLRLVSEDIKQYIELNRQDGALFVNGRIDREQLCRQSSVCSLSLQIALDNPLEIHRVVVEIRDVNDNSPSFSRDDFSLVISESIAPGTHFPVESAQDPDVGINTISNYHISPNEHFGLKVQTRSDGSKSAELLLEKALDREQQSTFQVILTAIDGGTPHRSGTAQIIISVLDSNDNAPVFDSELYRATVLENAPAGALVIKINAADKDKGSNGELTYSFTRHVSKKNRELFNLDPLTGEIRVQGVLDFEESSVYELDVEAVDRAPPALAGHAKVIVRLIDVNDNAPKVEVSSVSSSVPEDAPPGTVIALISVSDFDSEINGQIHCQIPDNVSFKLQPSSQNNYKLVTRDFLDREAAPVHDVSISAWDGGSPPLSTHTSIRISVSDINDNAPVFTHSLYNVYLTENNSPGASIFRVTAADSDKDHNSDVAYSILENGTEGGPGYITINSKNGDIYSLRSFDYEQLKQFHVKLQAQDAGSPPLSSSAVLNVIILDQNDNEPIIVSPFLWNSSAIVEIASQQLYPGYLITKIIAMDADSGQNGRLSYQMLEATNPQLFNVDSLSGEIRTTGSFGSQDLAAEKLVLSVKDNGQPRLSSTVTISFSILLNFSDNSFEFTQEPKNSEYLNFYLIILLGSTSLAFLLIIILLGIVTFTQGRNIAEGYNAVACCCNWGNSNITLKQRSVTTHTLNYSGPDNADGYGYTVCLTPESSNSEFMFLKPCQSTLPLREVNDRDASAPTLLYG